LTGKGSLVFFDETKRQRARRTPTQALGGDRP
jgi:hypothetical protein